MKYIASCLEGIEDIVEKETKGKKILKGRVLFTKKPENFKSVNKIYSLEKKFKFKDKRDLIKNFPTDIKIKKSFKIDCNREGKHKFKSVDIEKEIAKKLKNGKIDLKNPKTIIYVDIINNNCLTGVLIKDNLQKRNYRIKLNPESLNACLAFSLLELIKYKKGDILLDPYCRDGIIVIEASLQKKGKVFGLDKNVRNARINSKIVKVNPELHELDLEWLDTKFKKNSVKIATFLPSPSKRKTENSINQIYKEFFHQARFVVKDYLGIIVTKSKLIKKYIKSLKLVGERRIKIGEGNYFIMILKK